MRSRPALVLALLLVNNMQLFAANVVSITPDRPPTFDELREPQYVVAFSKLLAPEGVQGRVMPMRDVNGSEYSCYVPRQDAARGADAARATGADQVAELLTSQKTPGELLDSLTDWCTYRLEDWWQYEVCYKKHVRQFHNEGGKVVSEYLLGKYSEEESAESDVQLDASGLGGGTKYVMQSYVGGEPCELTGEARSAEVRYECGPEGDSVITSLLEPRSCHYRITIRTPRLCKHPAFQEQPPPVSIIRCYPLTVGEELERAGQGSHGSGDVDAGNECAAADGEDGRGTCSAGEGGRRLRTDAEKVTVSSSTPEGRGLVVGEEVEPRAASSKRLLKSLLDRQNQLNEDEYEDEEYEDEL